MKGFIVVTAISREETGAPNTDMHVRINAIVTINKHPDGYTMIGTADCTILCTESIEEVIRQVEYEQELM